MELRPLGFGEIFDRAVSLYICNFLPFAAMVAVLVLPLAVLQYVIDVSSQPEFDAIFRIFTHPGSAGIENVPSVFSSPATVGAFFALMVLTYAVWPFTLNAVAVGVARLYRDRPVEFRSCYEVVLRRWLQILGMIGLDALIVLVWYAVVFVILMIFAAVISAFALTGAGAAIVLGAVIGLLGFFLLLASLAPLFVALTFAMYSTVIEARPVMESLGVGFGRIFNRAEFWRAMLFSIAALAVLVAGSAIFGFIGLFAAFAHLPLLQTVVESVARAVITPFSVILLAIYYFDVRIRREAFDLESSLQRLAAPQPA